MSIVLQALRREKRDCSLASREYKNQVRIRQSAKYHILRQSSRANDAVLFSLDGTQCEHRTKPVEFSHRRTSSFTYRARELRRRSSRLCAKNERLLMADLSKRIRRDIGRTTDGDVFERDVQFRLHGENSS